MNKFKEKLGERRSCEQMYWGTIIVFRLYFAIHYRRQRQCVGSSGGPTSSGSVFHITHTWHNPFSFYGSTLLVSKLGQRNNVDLIPHADGNNEESRIRSTPLHRMPGFPAYTFYVITTVESVAYFNVSLKHDLTPFGHALMPLWRF